MKLLEDNVNTVTRVSATVLAEVAEKIFAILSKSIKFVGLYMGALQASGADVAGQVVDIAGRQRMLIQRIPTTCSLVRTLVSFVASLGQAFQHWRRFEL